jgi:hypothetical protein
MGRLNHDQEQLFYSFRLEDTVPHDHLVSALLRVGLSRPLGDPRYDSPLPHRLLTMRHTPK